MTKEQQYDTLIENPEFDSRLRNFGTSETQIRSMLENFDAGKMCQFNHHIEFLSPDGKWFFRITRVGVVKDLEEQIEIEFPTGVYWYPIEKESPQGELLIQHQVESGNIVLEIYPFDESRDFFYYRSITPDPEDSYRCVPVEKFINLSKVFDLPAAKRIYHSASNT